MLNENISKLLNEQVNKEFYSAYLYMDMANYYSVEGLNGFENRFLFSYRRKEIMHYCYANIY